VKLLESVSFRHTSWPLVIIAALLLAIGLSFVYSASFSPEFDADGDGGMIGEKLGSTFHKQLIWSAAGLCVFLAIICVDYRRIVERGYAIYAAGIVLLILTMIPPVGRIINNSRRWIGYGPIFLQTSEFMKIAVIVMLARYLPGSENRQRAWGLLLPLLVVLVPMVMIAKQPDLGTALLFLPLAAGLVYVAGARARHLIALGLVGVLSLPLLWLVMKPYQRERVSSFIQQDTADRRLLMDDLYHLTQSKAAIGSGGVLGKGWGKGTQNRLDFLPMRNTDFIFAVICEEWGFIRAAGVILLYFLLFWSCMRVADETRDPPARLLVVGVTVLLATQMLVNTGMSAGQLPTVGLPLPFISYGGSSLLTSFAALGLVVNVSMRPQIVLGREEFGDESGAG